MKPADGAGNRPSTTTRDPRTDDDEKIRAAIAEVRAGRTAAYGVVVRRTQSRLMAFAVSLLKERGAAEELVQDAFVRAFGKLERFDDRRPFYPWVATIAYRLAQNRWARERRERDRATRIRNATTDTTTPAGAIDTLIADEKATRLWRAVSRLPRRQRAAVTLFYRDEMPVREVARVLGVSSGTIKTLLFRARRTLRDLLTDDSPSLASGEST